MHEVLRRVSIIIAVFWDMTPYILVRRNPCIDLCVFTSEETLIFKGKGGVQVKLLRKGDALVHSRKIVRGSVRKGRVLGIRLEDRSN